MLTKSLHRYSCDPRNSNAFLHGVRWTRYDYTRIATFQWILWYCFEYTPNGLLQTLRTIYSWVCWDRLCWNNFHTTSVSSLPTFSFWSAHHFHYNDCKIPTSKCRKGGKVLPRFNFPEISLRPLGRSVRNTDKKMFHSRENERITPFKHSGHWLPF